MSKEQQAPENVIEEETEEVVRPANLAKSKKAAPRNIVPLTNAQKAQKAAKIQESPTDARKNSGSKGSKGSIGSVGSKGSVGSQGSQSKVTTVAGTNKPIIKPPAASKPVLSSPTAPKVVKPPAATTSVNNIPKPITRTNPQPVAQSSTIPRPPAALRQQVPQQFMNSWGSSQNVPSAQSVFNDDEPVVPPQEITKERVKQVKPYNLEEDFSIQVKSRQKIVKLSSTQDQLLPVMVNIKTKELTEEQEDERAPIDLICVVDISGSMCGEKIALVRKALTTLLELVNEKDRLCLIQFDDRAERLTPLMRVTAQNILKFQPKINALRDRGGTEISQGMDMAFRVIKERKHANPVTSIFLLTDGLSPGAAQGTENALAKRKLGEQTFTINCYGFGNDHDEDLLTKICKLKDGTFYFVKELDTIDECFAESLGGLMSVVALDVNIYVRSMAYKPFQGINIKKTFGEAWIKEGVTTGYKINLKQLYAGVEKGFVAQLLIPKSDVKISDTNREILVLQVDVEANDKTGKPALKRSAKLLISLANENEEVGEIDQDGEVMENYFRVKGAEALEEAVQDASKGQFDAGSKKLDQVIEQIKMNKKVNQEKLSSVVTQLVNSKQSCKPQVYHSYGKKAMVNLQSNMMMQRAAGDDLNMFSNVAQKKMVTKVKTMKMSKPGMMKEEEQI